MKKVDLSKYKGIIPAFYACYDDNGDISPTRTKNFTNYLINEGVSGLYVCGSSGECIYQSVSERKKTLESVMEVAKGKITVIAHVAATNTKDSVELAKHAKECGVDAVAAIPTIYFKLPEHSIESYWKAIASATDLDFIIYNIPQTTGYALSKQLFSNMIKLDNVIGVKNSSPAVQDIQMFKDIGGDDFIVFNGPDEQYIGGRIMGAQGGIGGTYGVMPKLYIKLEELFSQGKIDKARDLQFDICNIIYKMCSCSGNMYSVIKEIIKLYGIDIGKARLPLSPVLDSDIITVKECKELIDKSIKKYC